MQRVMDAILITQDPAAAVIGDEEDDDEVAPGESAAHQRVGRLQRTLVELLDREAVRVRLAELASELDDEVPVLWGPWLRTTLLETLGETVLQACIVAAPRQTAVDTLVMDIVEGPGETSRIWITETAIGGAGAIQAFADSFCNEPRSLFRAIEATLSPTDLEVAADGLEDYLSLVTTKPELADAAEQMRASLGHGERERARQALWERLADCVLMSLER